MNGRTLLASPVTQSRDAVKQLIAYQTHGQEPSEMPDFYRLSGAMVLVRNNKKDAYYVTTLTRIPIYLVLIDRSSKNELQLQQ